MICTILQYTGWTLFGFSKMTFFIYITEGCYLLLIFNYFNQEYHHTKQNKFKTNLTV